jgi:ubiquinone biosynthesis protein
MDRSSNRISFSMIISAILLSSAIMHATGVGPTYRGISLLGLASFGFAFVLGIWLIISIIRSGRL